MALDYHQNDHTPHERIDFRIHDQPLGIEILCHRDRLWEHCERANTMIGYGKNCSWIGLFYTAYTQHQGKVLLRSMYTAILLFSTKLTLYLHVTGTNCGGSFFEYC